MIGVDNLRMVQDCLCVICSGALLAIAAGTVVAFIGRMFRRSWTRWLANGRAFALLMACAVVVFAYCAAPVKRNSLDCVFDVGFVGGQAYVSTNDSRVVEFSWQRGVGVPATATADFFAIHTTEFTADGTNNLVNIGSTTMGAESFSVLLDQDASNYLYWAACNYIPPAPMHTNGVYTIKIIFDDSSLYKRYVPLGLEFWADGVRVSPAAELDGGAE